MSSLLNLGHFGLSNKFQYDVPDRSLHFLKLFVHINVIPSLRSMRFPMPLYPKCEKHVPHFYNRTIYRSIGVDIYLTWDRAFTFYHVVEEMDVAHLIDIVLKFLSCSSVTFATFL